MQAIQRPRLSAPMAVAFIMLATFVFLVLRSSGVYPSVFGDEYTYSSMSRVLPLSAASIPNYLYLLIYRGTLMCGDGFMGCTKVLNSAFFVCAAPFIYMTARRYCTSRVAAGIVGLAMLGPVNGYTTYFMPEPLFYLTFWIGVWYFLRYEAHATPRHWAIFGVIMGCAALVKPHAMFVIPAFSVSILFFSWRNPAVGLLRGVQSVLLFVIVMMATKWGLSLLIAGKAGLTLFGSFYSSTLESSASSLDRYIGILAVSPVIVAGHVLGLSVMFGLAVVVVTSGGLGALRMKVLGDRDKLNFATLMLLGNLVAMVTLFSASVAGSNAAETALRLHMRYYDFVFPLLFIAVAAQFQATVTVHRYVRWVIAGLAIAVILYAGITRMHPYTPSFIDAPELRGFTLYKKLFWVYALFSIATVVVWMRNHQKGARLFVLVFLPVSIFTSTVATNLSIRERLQADAYDRAGQFARQYLSLSDRSKLIVVGDNAASILRTLFWVEDLNAGPDLSYKPGALYTAAQSRPDRDWVLIVGDVDVAEDDFKLLRLNGFTLAKKRVPEAQLAIDFSKESLPEGVTAIKGRSHAESWGAWSEGGQLVLEFAEPLPKQFDLSLDIKGFGPNAGKSAVVQIGNEEYPVELATDMATRTVRVDNPQDRQRITIKVPQPVSPEQLGLSSDARALGVGLSQIRMNPVP